MLTVIAGGVSVDRLNNYFQKRNAIKIDPIALFSPFSALQRFVENQQLQQDIKRRLV